MAEPEADEAIHVADTLLRPAPPELVENARVRVLGIDVGGTFTDAVLVEADRCAPRRCPPRRTRLSRCSRPRPRSVRRAPTASRTAPRSPRTRCSSGAARGPPSSQRRASSTSSTSAARTEHTCTAPAPRIRLRSSRSSAASASRAGSVPTESSSRSTSRRFPAWTRTRSRSASSSRSATRPTSARSPRSSGGATPRHTSSPPTRSRPSSASTSAPRPPRSTRTSVPFSSYLRSLADGCAGAGLPQPLVMRSSGGLATLEEASRHAAFALLSGPAAGSSGATRIAALAGFENALSFDMGGTSTDVCAIVGGGGAARARAIRGRLPVRLPTLAVHTVGAGGGSIVREDVGGALRVGPESAGAFPGPACYGRGGDLTTVTDANLLLGRLPERLPGGIELDARSSRARARGLDPAAVVEVVDAEMTRALRVVSVEQGLDPRDFALVAFGEGAAPRLRACGGARHVHRARARRRGRPLGARPRGGGRAARHRALLRHAARRRRRAPDEGEADLRYAGQSFELTVARPAPRGAVPRGPPRALRLRGPRSGGGARRGADCRGASRAGGGGHRAATRSEGPAGARARGSTAWVPIGWEGETDAHGTLVLRRGA